MSEYPYNRACLYGDDLRVEKCSGPGQYHPVLTVTPDELVELHAIVAKLAELDSVHGDRLLSIACRVQCDRAAEWLRRRVPATTAQQAPQKPKPPANIRIQDGSTTGRRVSAKREPRKPEPPEILVLREDQTYKKKP